MEAPRITGVCAECLFEFDLKFGVDCPRCHNEAWLFNAYAPENSTKDVDELYRMFALRDNRTQ